MTVPIVYVVGGYRNNGKSYAEYVIVNWVVLGLLVLSVVVLFDSLRRIWVTMRRRNNLKSDTNMFIHMLSFSTFVVSRFAETFSGQRVQDNPDDTTRLNLAICSFFSEIGECFASLVLYYILFKYSGQAI